MSDDARHNGSREPPVDLAAEYVLGVLDAAARRDAERRMARDPHFAAQVWAWEARLLPLAESVPPVEPSPAVWRQIEAHINAMPGRDHIRQAPSLWQSLAFWRALTVGSIGLAAASLAGLFFLTREAVPPPLIAMLGQPSGGAPSFVTSVDRAHGTVLVVPTVAPALGGRAAELWLVPPGNDPQSLGIIDTTRPVTVAIPARLMSHATPDAALAVSLEPPGGSPTGKPTGPVVAAGKLTNL